MFVLEGAYDSWQLAHILGFPCATYGQSLENCSKILNASLESYGNAMRESIGVALDSTAHHKKHSAMAGPHFPYNEFYFKNFRRFARPSKIQR